MKSLKSIIKKSENLYNLYSRLMNGCICVVSYVSPNIASKIEYRYYFNRKLNLNQPKTLNEKMMYLKLRKYWNEQYVADCADKYAVRKIISDKGCPEILNELYGVWDRVEDINWDILPEKFVIKCNHGSGYNIICKNKALFDVENAKKLLKKWMNERYGLKTVEQGIYNKIKKKILAEKFIDTKSNIPPNDYKFFCSYGEVKFLFVASDRYNGHTKFDYYYPNWTWIPVKNQHPNKGPIEKPKMLDIMIHYAEVLSKSLPLVRVDLYNEGNKIIFGELTFTHFGCLNTYDPGEYDFIFGQCFPDIKELQFISPKIK